jgi:hypothetical protein
VGVANTRNGFIKSDVDVTAASGWLDLPSDSLIRAVLVKLLICQGEVVKDKLLNRVLEAFGDSDLG